MKSLKHTSKDEALKIYKHQNKNIHKQSLLKLQTSETAKNKAYS